MPLPASILNHSRIVLDADITSKKRVLEAMAELLSPDEKQQNTIFEKLLERERLGSTGLGHGIALPHARVDGLTLPRAAFIRLREGTDFDSPDGDMVTLVLALLVPQEATDEHLQLLASIASLFNQESFRKDLLQASTNEEIHHLLTQDKERLRA